MADAPDITLFHSEDLESRVKALENYINHIRNGYLIYLGMAVNNQTITFTIPTSSQFSGGVYIVTIQNGYGVGSVWIIRTASSQSSSSKMNIINISETNYFKLETISNEPYKFNIKSTGASGYVYLVRIA